MMKRLIKPLFLLFITTSVSAQGVNAVVDAPGVLKSLLNNSYSSNTKTIGGKVNTSLKHYLISNETEVLNAQNTYVYEADKLTEMIFESDLQESNPDVQKFVIVYDNDGRVKELDYLNKENESWILTSKTEYLTDESGFGDTINTYFMNEGHLNKNGIISFVKSNGGKTIESIGSYNSDTSDYVSLVKTVYKLDVNNRLTTYESYNKNMVSNEWVHIYDYYFEYNAANNLTVRYLQSFVTGLLFKTEYHYLADGRLDYYELSQKDGENYILGSKSNFGYDDKLNLNYFLSQEFSGNSYVDKSKQLYTNDEFGNPLSIEYYYLENGSLVLKEKNILGYASVTNLPENETAEKSFSLNQNYPNPFNPNTVISFDLKESGFVTLKVFDLLGREVATLANGYLPKGVQKFSFDGSNLTSGIYVYQLRNGNSVETRKMMLMK